MDWLDGLDAHWLWFAIGLVLAGAEMLVPGVYLMWLAMAALAVTPDWARTMLDLDDTRWRHASRIGRPAGAAMMRTLRWAIDHPADDPTAASRDTP